jgi:cysteine desulfurase / selenocysteine lyase
MIDWEQVRREYSPAVDKAVHFDQGRIGLTSREVLEAQLKMLSFQAEEPWLIGRFLNGQKNEIPEEFRAIGGWVSMNNLRGNIAQEIGASPEEIFLTSGTTDSLRNAAWLPRWNKRDRFLTTDAEYDTIYYDVAEPIIDSRDVILDVAPILPFIGEPDFPEICVEFITNRITGRTKVLLLSDVLRSSGVTLPIKEIAHASKQKNPNLLVVVDSAQSFGQMKIDVKDYECDAVGFAGHKWLGAPIGSGGLYVSKQTQERNDCYLSELVRYYWDRHDADIDDRMSALGVTSYAAVGSNEALNLYQRLGAENVHQRNSELAAFARERLASIAGLELFPRQVVGTPTGIVSFNIEGHRPQEIREALERRKILISDLHTYDGSTYARACFHYYNKPEEIDRLAEELEKLV